MSPASLRLDSMVLVSRRCYLPSAGRSRASQ
jgi:hypothetical protein